MNVKNHIARRSENGIFEYVRRVPMGVRHLDKRGKIKKSLGTRDAELAREKGRTLDEANERLWGALLKGDAAKDPWEAYRAAMQTASALGFQYRPLGSLVAEADVEEIVRRVLAAHQHIDRKEVVDAVLGTATEPTPKLSQLWGLYERYNAAALEGFSPNQLRKHKAPRARAVAYAIDNLGDLELGRITRQHVLDFRDWWTDKLIRDGLKADSLNRCFTDIKGMLTVVDGALRTSYGDVWERVRVKATNKTKSGVRPPFAPEWVQEQLLRPGALDGLNLEARTVVYLMAETGARPSELCNLRPEDVVLDTKIPHIRVSERDDRRRKTTYSIREIPLVGCALWAMKQLPGGFVQYADREDVLSNTVNKYLLENNLRPTKAHVLYSLRHTFQDRILAAGAPDRLQAGLMGHEFNRPVYGEGASLEQKLELLERIKFMWAPLSRPADQ